MQVELYNSIVEKEGTDGEEEARKAYKAAREDSGRADEQAAGDKVSSALIDRVRHFQTIWICYFNLLCIAFQFRSQLPFGLRCMQYIDD